MNLLSVKDVDDELIVELGGFWKGRLKYRV
jgi:hypothetical protein